MERKGNHVLKRSVKSIGLVAVFSMALISGLWAQSSWDSEKLALEMTMQRRVESALSKILPPGRYVVVVRIDPVDRLESGQTGQGRGPGFYLPGVPSRQSVGGTEEAVKDLVESLKPGQREFLRFVKRISATMLLDQAVEDEKVEKVRELARQILGLDPERGDTLDIQKTDFGLEGLVVGDSGISRFQKSLRDYWLIISLALILVCIVVFFLFVFGPLRGFLNRFVQVLPTLKPLQPERPRSNVDTNVLQAMLAQTLGMNPGGQGGINPSNFSGSLMVENPNKKTTPFGFIREDHLSNLATLLSREDPEKAAVVLGYLPPEWISRVLAKLDPSQQTDITEHLATTRQLLPEQVEDIEQDLKRRLDYLIGGPDRLMAVYESLDPDNQKKMLDNLRTVRPELAEELRKKTFLFEDLQRLEPNSLKTILREVELQTLIMALKGTSEDFRQKIVECLSAGKAEIVKEELEFNEGAGGRASTEAQKQMAILARQLEREGQIEFPKGTTEEVSPSVRYGGSLRSTLKLPAGLDANEQETVEAETVQEAPVENVSVTDRIREFMNRGKAPEKERYPLSEEDNEDDNNPQDDEKGAA